MNLMDILAASLPNEQQIYAQNPFISSGQALAQTQLGVPTTNTEAILGPALQGLISGTLQGYGRRQANQQVYDAYKANPLLQAALEKSNIGPVASGADYSQLMANDLTRETPSPDWTPAAAKTQILMQALGLQSQQDAEAKRAELMAQYDPKIMKAKALEAGMIEEAKNASKPESKTSMTPVKEVEDFINAAFDKAASAVGGASLLPGTKARTLLNSNNEAMINYMQILQGTEKSDIARREFKEMLVDFNDSKEEIELKRKQFLDLARKSMKLKGLKVDFGDNQNKSPTVKYSVNQLQDAGYSPADINALMAQGVVE